MRGDVAHLDRVAQIGLVGAVALHRVAIGDAWKGRGGDRPAIAEFLEDAVQYRLDRGKHILLRHKRHFEIELVELARRAVGAARFVAKARRDLEIAVEPGDHQQLLELLRRLRQRVEFARVQPARHVVGARALGRVGGQDRRLKFGEALGDHPPADRGDDLRAQHDVGVHLLAPQIEKAVGEAHLLGVFGIAVDRERQRQGLRLDFDRGDHELDLAGIEPGVDGVGRTGGDPPGHRRHTFQAQRVGGWEQRRGGVDHALGDAVVIAQIDKQQMAVIALAVDPPRQPGRTPRIGEAQRGAGMGAIGVHWRLVRRGGCRRAGTRHGTAPLVKTAPGVRWPARGGCDLPPRRRADMVAALSSEGRPELV